MIKNKAFLVIPAYIAGIACALAKAMFASIPGPEVSFMPGASWWKLAFITTQQVCYFGIHAFTADK